MAKVKKSKKRKKYAKRFLVEHVPFSSKEMKDADLVVEILLDCIKTGDINTFREVLVGHLITTNRSHIAKVAGIGRRTLYDLLDPRKEFNPGLTTISAVIQAIAA